jgi:asparagine synthase (glutamine-hydrolysing)
MCSISGIMRITNCEFRNAELEDKTLAGTVERMNDALHHRGPDDSGISKFEIQNSKFKGHLCLGNTRLAIIDTSTAGHQPMLDPQTGNWITYNGETYNYRDLREEIGGEFGPWRSNTDTEVVLRAYRKWGADAFKKLRGMFALAIWDAQRQELVLARDPFGIKPLYYCHGVAAVGPQDSDANKFRNPAISQSRNSFLFASEIRALLASGLISRKLSDDGVASYLEYGSVQAPLTIIEGVRSVMPGQVLRVSEKGVSSSEFKVSSWDVECMHRRDAESAEGAQRIPQSRTEAVTQLRSILEESVRMHLVSDVPLGVFLSGGMDSSAVVALMSQVSRDKPKTFSVVFNEEEFTEATHSRLVAEKFQTDHCEVHLGEDQLLEMLPKAISALDQPTMDGINTYVVSKAVKEAGVTVALSGLGGDELFAGYPSFRRALRVQGMSDTTKRALRAASAVGKIALNSSVQRQKFWQLAASDGQPWDVYNVTRQLFSPDDIRKISDSQVQTANTLSRQLREIRNPQFAIRNLDFVNDVSQLELQGYMANTLLRDADSMSMAHSLEVRVPFIDAKVLSYVLSLRGEWKLTLGNGKRPKQLLADALDDLLPKDFLARPKMGFTLPFEKWMQSLLRDEISSVFEDEAQLGTAGLKHDGVGKVWRRFLNAPQTVGWSRPWALYVLTRWCQSNGVSK